MSTFIDFSKAHKPYIQTSLKNYLTTPLGDVRDTLLESITYSACGDSKCIRPLLTLATFSLVDQNFDKIISVACAIEMIHAYSLIHDDLPAMDDDTLRRGKPTCHIAYDEATAILAGDTLNSFAFEVLSKDLVNHFPAEKVLKAIHHLASACGVNGMAGGQYLDINHDKNTLDKTQYLTRTHQLKTGAMIKASIMIPAHLVLSKPEELTLLDTFADHIGLLFQITDDIIDATQSTETLGKTAGKDSHQDKLTYVTLYGLDKAKQLTNETAQQAMEALNQLPYETNLLKDFVTTICNRQK